MQYGRKLAEWGEYPVQLVSVMAVAALFIGIIGACDSDASRNEAKVTSSQPVPSSKTPAKRDTLSDAVSVVSTRSSHVENADAKSEGTSNRQPPEYRPATIPPWRPLRNAAVGQWVEYESLERMRVRYDVLHVKPEGVTTQVTVHQDGRNLGVPAMREDDSSFDELEAQAKRRKATRNCQPAMVEVGGRQFDCLLYEDRWVKDEISYVCRTWVSAAVPFLGTVRMELYGADRLEARLVLMGFGDSSRSPKPN